MKVFEPQNIRNVVLVGHKASGKTSLAESALWAAKATARLGSTSAGTSVLDHEPEEQKRVMSTTAAVASFEWRKTKLNLLDTPGDANFLRDTRMTMSAADAAVCVVSAKDGMEPMTERVLSWAKKSALPKAFVVSKMDVDNADFGRTVADIRAQYGSEAVAVQMPIGSGSEFRGVVDLLSGTAFMFEDGDSGRYERTEIPSEMKGAAEHARNELIEDIAANDEELMEKFFEEALTPEELAEGLARETKAGTISPIFCGSGTLNRGITPWLDALVAMFPSPLERSAWSGRRGDDPAELAPDPSTSPTCVVFKTLIDPHAGKISVLRVLSGTVQSDLTLVNSGRSDGHKERFGQPQSMLGKKLEPIDQAMTGDIFAVAKLKDVHTGDTLSSDDFVADTVTLDPPLVSRAVHASEPAHEDKVHNALLRIVEEDPGLSLGRDEHNGEMLLSGTGQQHIEVAVERMERKFGVSTRLQLPRIPYQETFTAPVQAVEGKHKKQSGGHGQFAVVMMDFAPAERGAGLVFEDAVVGGSVPRSFVPSVEKGLNKVMGRGVLAGHPVVDVTARLYDGKHHPVDSSDMAFQIAASKAFKQAAEKAHPVLLEPIMDLEITVPEENMGDVMSDVSSRRGRLSGSEVAGAYTVIRAQIPLAEIQTYEATLRSMTHGRGLFTMQPSHMEPVPAHVQEKIIQASGFTGHEEED